VVSSGFLYPMVKVKVQLITQIYIVATTMTCALIHSQIVDMDSGKILGYNALGKLYVHSPYLMRGYLIHKEKEVRLKIIKKRVVNLALLYKFSLTGWRLTQMDGTKQAILHLWMKIIVFLCEEGFLASLITTSAAYAIILKFSFGRY
jgi:hypothetical protein